jgi:hypothetical protein
MESSNGIRKPVEIMHHMCQVVSYTQAVIANSSPSQLPPLDGPAEVKRLYSLLKQVDQLLVATDLEPTLILKLIQGPLADLLTHVGQIALLRRAFNDPVACENFMNARVAAGVLNQEDQALSK